MAAALKQRPHLRFDNDGQLHAGIGKLLLGALLYALQQHPLGAAQDDTCLLCSAANPI
jgi:hypothetical protein